MKVLKENLSSKLGVAISHYFSEGTAQISILLITVNIRLVAAICSIKQRLIVLKHINIVSKVYYILAGIQSALMNRSPVSLVF